MDYTADIFDLEFEGENEEIAIFHRLLAKLSTEEIIEKKRTT